MRKSTHKVKEAYDIVPTVSSMDVKFLVLRNNVPYRVRLQSTLAGYGDFKSRPTKRTQAFSFYLSISSTSERVMKVVGFLGPTTERLLAFKGADPVWAPQSLARLLV